MNIDWGAVWAFVWPILKQAIIAFLVALLALLGYDDVILPVRLRQFGLRSGNRAQSAGRGSGPGAGGSERKAGGR